MCSEDIITDFLKEHQKILQQEALELKNNKVSVSKDDEKENVEQNCLEGGLAKDSESVKKDCEVEAKEQISCKKNETDLVEKLDLSLLLAQSRKSDLFRSDGSYKGAMLRYGQYSPNNPQLKLDSPALPYLGHGEYDQQKRRQLLRIQLESDYKKHTNLKNEQIKSTSFKLDFTRDTKSVQTDIRNIRNQLIQATDLLETNTADSGGGDYYNLIGPHSTATTNESLTRVMHNNRSPVLHRLDQRITAAQNTLLLKSDQPSYSMDKPTRGILTNRRDNSRDRLVGAKELRNLPYAQPPALLDGFSYTDRSEDLERERIKRELYQNELRLQIEEKRRLAAMREEQDRREQEMENRRLEQQLMRMHEEQLRDEQRRNRREQMRRNSDDYALRKQQQQQLSRALRKETEASLRSTTMASTKLSSSSHYSPPVSRRYPSSAAAATSYSAVQSPSTSNALGGGGSYSDPLRYNRYDTTPFVRKNMLNRMDSLNVYGGGGGASSYDRNSFSRYDSLSRIDSLKQQQEEALLNSRLDSLSVIGDNHADQLMMMNRRRHSATHQDLCSSSRRSPQLTRRSCSGRFLDDNLGGGGGGCGGGMIPLLKAHSPVARELKYSHAVNSNMGGTSLGGGGMMSNRYGGSSEALRKLEDRWQIPDTNDNAEENEEKTDKSKGILAQLGTMRLQLQREQLRMDASLIKRNKDRAAARDVATTVADDVKDVD